MIPEDLKAWRIWNGKLETLYRRAGRMREAIAEQARHRRAVVEMRLEAAVKKLGPRPPHPKARK